MFDASNAWNRIRQLDCDRRFGDVASGRVEPNIDDMALGEAKKFNIAVMHVDMDHFTEITGDLSNADKLRLLNIYLSDLTAVIRDHDGFIEKYVGDGITALFGAGKGGSEAVKNAIECAMTIQAEIEHAMGKYLRQIGLPSFTCSIGMDYGATWVARVGVRGSNQLTLVGNEVIIAKDLEELAGDGETLVGASIYSELSQKRQEYCERQPQSEDFSWELNDKPYPYYKYLGQWVVPGD